MFGHIELLDHLECYYKENDKDYDDEEWDGYEGGAGEETYIESINSQVEGNFLVFFIIKFPCHLVASCTYWLFCLLGLEYDEEKEFEGREEFVERIVSNMGIEWIVGYIS